MTKEQHGSNLYGHRAYPVPRPDWSFFGNVLGKVKASSCKRICSLVQNKSLKLDFILILWNFHKNFIQENPEKTKYWFYWWAREWCSWF